MARVLVTYWRADEISANATLNFWDGFCTELRNLGNDVLIINNSFYNIWTSNTTDNPIIESYLNEEVESFSPELIITFNNRILKSIVKKYKDIPIVIYDGDELKFFSDLDGLRKNTYRYKIFTLSKSLINDYLEFGFKKDQVFFMPTATAIRADSNIEQVMNISFLGQRRWFLNKYVLQAIRDGRDLASFYNTYLEHIKTNNFNYAELFKKNDNGKSESEYSDSDLWPLFDDAYLVFANLIDLGLHLGGHEGMWRDIVEFIPQLAICHKPDRVFTLNENQKFYNSSILSLSPMHPQSRGKGFSWRCFDIMASNACLVSSYSSELKEQTEKYVQIPMYTSPAECREICVKLLHDKDMRNDIALASQEYIEKNCRWIDRFKEMEQILGIELITPGRIGNLKKLPVSIPDDYLQNSCKKNYEFSILKGKCEIIDVLQSIKKHKIKLLKMIVPLLINKTILIFEKFSTWLKQSQFTSSIILCLIFIYLLQISQEKFLTNPILPEKFLLALAFVISFIGMIFLLLANLFNPMLHLLILFKNKTLAFLKNIKSKISKIHT